MYQSEFVWGNLLSYAKPRRGVVKFIYSEKATKFCEISTVDLTNLEYMNFNQPFTVNNYSPL